MHERARLARAGGGQHEERAVRRRSRRALLAVENLAEIYSVHGKSASHYTKSPRRETANCATLRLKDGGGFGILFILFQEE